MESWERTTRSDGRYESDGVFLVSVEEERALISSILSAVGTPAAEVAVQADILVEADLRGHPSHGLQRLPVIVERIRSGLTVPGASVGVDWPTAAFVRIDGGRGLGPVVARHSIDLILARAAETGIAVAAISNSNHLGMLAPYVETLAERGLIGIAMTTSEALVHPFGGRRAMLGTNPLAVGLPAEPHPFVFDMATGVVSMGRILAHLSQDEPIPLGWAVDEEGVPTTDPAAAARGSISPFGGAKGYGLGLAIELLVSVLTESSTGRQVRGTLDTTDVCNKGDVFLCADPGALGLVDGLGRVTAYLSEIRNESGSPGEVVTVPGDRSRSLRESRVSAGVPVAVSVWERAIALQRETIPKS